jgi:hypothetical protein
MAPGIEGQAVLFGNLADTRAERADITRTAIQAERDILVYRHCLKEREVLEDHAKAELTRAARLSHNDGTPLPEDMPRIGLQQPIEHLDQGRLPGTVLAEQGMHLTRTHS